MNQNLVLICIGAFFLVSQIFFCITSMRWLASGKRKRDKEFALLDSDRQKLIQMQSQLKSEVSEARKLSEDTLKKLKIIGAEAHAEWEDMTKKINTIILEVEKSSDSILQNNVSVINAQKLALDKSVQESKRILIEWDNRVLKTEKIFKLFDSGLPVDEILKDIQASKYEEARTLLASGVEASVISKKLGINLSEITLLSSFS